MLTEQDYRNALVSRYPFWQGLSPTAVKQRIEQLLSAPNATFQVQSLSPVEYTVLLKEAADLRPQLLQLGQPEQIRIVLDLDCWQHDILQVNRILMWLEDLQRSGTEVFAQTLRILDAECLVYFLRQYLRVEGAMPSEEDDEPIHYDETLMNELYRTEFIDPDNPINSRIERVLNFMRIADLDLYYYLMQAAMWEQDSDLSDWAYRWKSGRLQDEGFPEYYEALESYHLLNLDDLTPMSQLALSTPAPPESVETSELIPTYVWSMTQSGSFLDRALDTSFSLDTLERLCWEMVALCNRELVYDQVNFADAAAVRACLDRVHAYLNIGLEFMSGGDGHQLSSLLSQHPLQLICQVGFTLVMQLSQRAERIKRHIALTTGVRRALPSLARDVLSGLLQPRPLVFEGLKVPLATRHLDFQSLQDIALIDPVLQQIERNPAYGLDIASAA